VARDSAIELAVRIPVIVELRVLRQPRLVAVAVRSIVLGAAFREPESSRVDLAAQLLLVSSRALAWGHVARTLRVAVSIREQGTMLRCQGSDGFRAVQYVGRFGVAVLAPAHAFSSSCFGDGVMR
jgi:hypothetical protein